MVGGTQILHFKAFSLVLGLCRVGAQSKPCSFPGLTCDLSSLCKAQNLTNNSAGSPLAQLHVVHRASCRILDSVYASESSLGYE